MPFRKILCPVDFSPGSEHALQIAARLAAQRGAEVVVAHSWHLPATAYTLETPIAPEMVQAIVDDSEKRLDTSVRAALAAGASKATGELISGPPWAMIVQMLDSDEFDLCVIGTHGRTGLARVLMGSVAEKVVRHAPCDVLAVHPRDDVKPGAFDHVLVPTDFSAASTQALLRAAELVKPDGVITLVHAVEMPVTYADGAPILFSDQAVEKRAREQLAKATEELQTKTKARVLAELRMGPPAGELLSLLDGDRTIDLVVVGSHGRTGIKRVLLGSVAEKIVRHAGRPVLVARTRE